jgi:hypothetical protein
MNLYNRLFFFNLLVIFSFVGCNEKPALDPNGQWFISKSTFNNHNINDLGQPRDSHVEVRKSTSAIDFDDNGTVVFPGVNSYDIPCTWNILDLKLIIKLDTNKLVANADSDLEGLLTESLLKHNEALRKRYNDSKDSVLKTQSSLDMLKASAFYVGTYDMGSTRPGVLIISSPSTRIELVSISYLMKKLKDNKLFKNIDTSQ